MKSYLITGAAGYIGSIVTNQLIKEGNSITIFDNLSTGNKKLLHPKADFREGDLRESENLEEAFSSQAFDAVIHLAALSSVEQSLQKPQLYEDNNVLGTQMLLEKMKRHGVHKLIFSSTAAVYGEAAHQPIPEDSPLSPINPYGKSKQACEVLIQEAHESWKLQFVTLRYFNAAGASEDGLFGELHDPETHLIPTVLRAAQENQTFSIFGTDYNTPDGTAIRDFIHVEDIADAHLISLKYLENDGASETFNIGSDKGYSVKEVVKLSKKVVQKDFPTEERDRRIGDPPILIADSSKIRRQLNWTPKRPLEQMISDSWAWLLDQEAS